MSDKLYNILKYTQRIALPAVLAFLATVLPLFGVDESVVRIIAAVGGAVITLFGALMHGLYINWEKEQKGAEDGETFVV